MESGTTSVWAHDTLSLGDRVTLNGPYGTFIGDAAADTPVLCLASGSGLAPITSLASAALLRGGFRNKASVLFSARTKEDLFENGLFSFLDAKFRNFKYNFALYNIYSFVCCIGCINNRYYYNVKRRGF